MAKYRERTGFVDAWQFKFPIDKKDAPSWVVNALLDGEIYVNHHGGDEKTVQSRTFPGEARQGDWIVRRGGNVLIMPDHTFREAYVPHRRKEAGWEEIVDPGDPTDDRMTGADRSSPEQ